MPSDDQMNQKMGNCFPYKMVEANEQFSVGRWSNFQFWDLSFEGPTLSQNRRAVGRELAELKEKLALLTGGTGGTGGTAPSASTVDKREAVHLKKCLVDVWMNIDEHGMGDVMYHIVFVIQLCDLEMF